MQTKVIRIFQIWENGDKYLFSVTSHTQKAPTRRARAMSSHILPVDFTSKLIIAHGY